MYKIDHIQDKSNNQNYIVLKSPNKTTQAKIFLSLGGSLQNLKLNKNVIIKDLFPLKYDTSYSSAILFPFVNRLKNGTYTFMQKEFTLDLNLKKESNALHGLVYNKKFNLINQEAKEDSATITLEYTETEKPKGFPFNYNLLLRYTLTQNSLILKVNIKNTDNQPFPFNIGWHPYFISSNLYESFLSFKSDQKITFNEAMILEKTNNLKVNNDFQIKDRQFDDCYILNTNSINFKTPDYSIKINSSSEENFVQLFTPNLENTIAIEPTTGASNSFNNKIGLQVLEADDTYNVQWTIKLLENE